MKKDNIAVMMFLRNIFFCCVLFSFLFYPYLAFAEEDTRPDSSVACPSSEERAKVWGVPLLKPEQLMGPLAFLNVPYPKRDYELAARELSKIIHVGSKLSEAPAIWSSHKEERPNDIEYPPTDRFLLIELLLDAAGIRFTPPIKHTASYMFVVDEGCGNLTVWRVGLVSSKSSETIRKIIIRRTFYDADFTKRGIPFVFRDFDQMTVPVGSNASNSPMGGALWAISRGSLTDLTKTLVNAGMRLEAAHQKPYGMATYFSYVPDYRPHIASGWQIKIEHNADQIRKIYTQAPSATYP